MLGVGIFEFDDPLPLSTGEMGGALAFSVLMSFVYRWGVQGLISPLGRNVCCTIKRRRPSCLRLFV